MVIERLRIFAILVFVTDQSTDMLRRNGIIRRAKRMFAAVFATQKDASAGDFTKNELVRNELRKHGDDGSKSRPIDHFAYFPTHEGKMQYRDFLVSRGYSITREAMDASQTARWGIQFSKPQAPNEIDREVELLSTVAVKFGGEYDGWGTDVEGS